MFFGMFETYTHWTVTRVCSVFGDELDYGLWPQCSEVLLLISSFLQMLMPKKNRIAIYELLFKEGVMVAKKDVHMPKHPELADKNVPNLYVMKAMQVTGALLEWGADRGGLFHWCSRQIPR